MSTGKFRVAFPAWWPPRADAPRGRYDAGPMDETATALVTGLAQLCDLHALKTFAPDRRVRKMLFKTDQLWSEIACYEPGQSTVMHQHPREEEAIFVLEGTAHMSIDGQEVVVPAGSIVKVPPTVLPHLRHPGPDPCVILVLQR